VSSGKVEEAGRLLGRPPIILGRVVHGDKLGEVLGYPTANLLIDDNILVPGDGIYLVNVFWSNGRSPGLLYAGRRPSVDGRNHRLEVHLLGQESGAAVRQAAFQDLYGATLEVHILQRIRDDQYFATLSDLRRQMAVDVEQASKLLLTSNWPKESIIT
jgi:riboflavin kinase/FMN adenylyltransferase